MIDYPFQINFHYQLDLEDSEILNQKTTASFKAVVF